MGTSSHFSHGFDGQRKRSKDCSAHSVEHSAVMLLQFPNMDFVQNDS